MKIEDILLPLNSDQINRLTRRELVHILEGEQDIRRQLTERLNRLEQKYKECEEELIFIGDKYVRVKKRIFAPSSEKMPSPKQKIGANTNRKPPKDRKLLPSERYPHAPVEEIIIELETIPTCQCCGNEMKDSGLYEESEYLTVEPKKFKIIRQKRSKYNCGNCYSSLITAPGYPRILPGSTYDDKIIIDVSVNKFCDLIPIERYVAIAKRSGFYGLPANSLIDLTHHFANFLVNAYQKCKEELLEANVLRADETPHRMLEDNDGRSWYLWGFSTEFTSYFECHSTRSGEVAADLIKMARCRFLLTDVYSGYSKAVSVVNIWRKENKLELLQSAYCNAHCRRKFVEAIDNYPVEANYFIMVYQKIYELEGHCKGQSWTMVLEIRSQMIMYFEEMKIAAEQYSGQTSSKSSLSTALGYFLKNYSGLTLFITNPDIPIDNNGQERNLRNPVIGRKTWYGTHSKKGAQTACVIFTLVESCKVNNLNPRDYFRDLVDGLHRGEEAFTPKKYKEMLWEKDLSTPPSTDPP